MNKVHKNLQSLLDTDTKNQIESLQSLGPSSILIDRILEFYNFFINELNERQQIFSSEKKMLPALFMLESTNKLLLAGSFLLKGYFDSAFRETRVAIELAAMSHKVMTNTVFCELWLESSTSQENYEDFRSKFSQTKIFYSKTKNENASSIVKLIKSLEKRFDIASKQAHANIYSLSSKFKVIKSEKSILLQSTTQSFNAEYPEALKHIWLWVSDTHIEIMKVFGHIFDDLKKDKVIWKTRFIKLCGIINTHKSIAYQNWISNLT